ncbi:MAG: hypothetical protein ACLQVI_00480 [Polyangiaceae bacterium]
MKGFRTGVATSALLLIFVPYYACIPNPDVSALPPFDGGGVTPTPTEDSGSEDATVDSTVIAQDSGQADTAPLDSAVPVGTINGVVIDYAQGLGKGVAPNAVVTLSIPGSPSANVPAPVTADVNGLFTISNVPAGVSLQISVTKPTDLVNQIAYSTSLLVATVAPGQTLSVYPVLHEGCFQTFVLPGSSQDAAANQPVTLQNAQCRGGQEIVGAYAAMTFEATSFSDPATSALWSQAIRVEMIPLAYPENPANDDAPDLSWALALPGSATPSGLLGAAEYRVVKSDPGQSDDGEPLALSGAANSAVAIAVPIYAATPAATLTSSYNPTTGAWQAESATPGAVQQFTPSETTLYYQMVTVPHLTWWAVTTAPTTTSCMTGTLQGATGNVFVRGAGANYLGTSTAVTSSGAFCLNVNSAAGSQVEIYAGALVGGVPSSLTLVTGVSPTSSGTCGGATTGCTAIPTTSLNLTPSVSCISGNIQLIDDAAAPSPLNVIESFQGLNYTSGTGIQEEAYLGQVTVGANGSYCALGVPGGSVYLSEPSGCEQTNSVTLPNGSNAPVCSAGGCLDAGTSNLFCP